MKGITSCLGAPFWIKARTVTRRDLTRVFDRFCGMSIGKAHQANKNADCLNATDSAHWRLFGPIRRTRANCQAARRSTPLIFSAAMYE